MAFELIAYTLFTAIAISPLPLVGSTGGLPLPVCGLLIVAGTLSPKTGTERPCTGQKGRMALIGSLLVAAILVWISSILLVAKGVADSLNGLFPLLVFYIFEGTCLYRFSRVLAAIKHDSGTKGLLGLAARILLSLLPYALLVLVGGGLQPRGIEPEGVQASLVWENVQIPVRYHDLIHPEGTDLATRLPVVACVFLLITLLAVVTFGETARTPYAAPRSPILALALGLSAAGLGVQAESLAAQLSVAQTFAILAAALIAILAICSVMRLHPRQSRIDDTETIAPIDLSTYPLSTREKTAAEMRLQMHSSAEIAAAMGVSASTVRTYLSRALAKMGTESWEDTQDLLKAQKALPADSSSPSKMPHVEKVCEALPSSKTAGCILAAWGCLNVFGSTLKFLPDGYRTVSEMLLAIVAISVTGATAMRASGQPAPSETTHTRTESLYPLGIGVLFSFSTAFPFTAFQGMPLALTGLAFTSIALFSCWGLSDCPGEPNTKRTLFALGLLSGHTLISACGLYCQTALLLDDSVLFSIASSGIGLVTLAALTTIITAIVRQRQNHNAPAPQNESLNENLARALLQECGMSELAADIAVQTAKGLSANRICADLHVAPGTVQGARHKAYRILDAHDALSLRNALMQRTR